MKALSTAIWVELLKARRSRVPFFTAFGITLAPLMSGLFMFILEDLERARRLGILGAKAQLTAGVADWPTYLGLLAQAVAVGGMLVFAIAAAWMFGREFADHTVRILLALPTARWAVVTAKALVLIVWCSVLAAWVLVLGLAIGALISLPGFSGRVLLEGISTFALIAGMTIALQTTTAFVASAGRGYLAPLGWALLTLFLAQVLAATGWGAIFPWSIPALASGVAGTKSGLLQPTSFAIVAVTALAGFAGLVLWWQKADQPM
jgi:ABC-2 type transport system permease protein